MSTAPVSILVFLCFLFASTYGLRRAFILFLFLAPFLPAYIAIPFGGGGAGVSALRISIYVMFLFLIISLCIDTKGWNDVIKCWGNEKVIAFGYITLTLSRVISTAINQNTTAIIYALDEAILIFTLLALSTRAFLNYRNFYRIATTYRVVIFLTITLLLVEILIKSPIPSMLFKISVTTSGENVLDGMFREGRYRAQGFFDNPLSLAEFLIYMAIFLLLFIRRIATRNQWVYTILAAVLFSLTLFTGSRFAAVIFVITICVHVFFSITRHMRLSTQKIIATSTISMILIAILIFSSLMANIGLYIDQFSFLVGDDASSRASIISRAQQWVLIPATISSNDFYGVLGDGYRSDILERTEIQLDSYYFRLLIEGGWLAVFSFLLICIGVIISCLSFLKYGNHAPYGKLKDKHIAFFLIIFILAFCFTKLFLSLTSNNYLLYVLTGLLVSLNSRKLANFQSSTSPQK